MLELAVVGNAPPSRAHAPLETTLEALETIEGARFAARPPESVAATINAGTVVAASNAGSRFPSTVRVVPP